MSCDSELAVTYATLALFDSDIAITEPKIQAILDAANVSVQPYWLSLFKRALESTDLEKLILSVGCAPSSAPSAVSDAPAEKVEEAPKEQTPESDEEEGGDMSLGIFGDDDY